MRAGCVEAGVIAVDSGDVHYVGNLLRADGDMDGDGYGVLIPLDTASESHDSAAQLHDSYSGVGFIALVRRAVSLSTRRRPVPSGQRLLVFLRERQFFQRER